MAYRDTWTLETIFPGGVEGQAFKLSVAALEPALAEHTAYLRSLSSIEDDPDGWRKAILQQEDLYSTASAPTSFSGCWAAVRSRDPGPRTARQAMMEFYARLQECRVLVTQQLDLLSDEAFAEFVAPLEDQRPGLEIMRNSQHLRGNETVETLIAQLNPQALHGWGTLYNMVAGRLKATLKLDGKPEREVGISELTLYHSSPEESDRKAAFLASQAAWTTEQDVCALALNQITETRRKRNARADVDDLEHSLRNNRLEREALDAMFTACDAARPALLRYIDRKNQILGKEEIHPWNMRVPLRLEEEDPLTWDETCSSIIASFEGFDPEMAQFADRALREGWVDAVPGPDRRTGGFCAGIESIEESRIFMTFNGRLRSAMTLAHELGHAWHNEVLFDQAPARRSITSSTAETASTFGEALFRDYIFDKAPNDYIRIQMLDQQLMAGTSFLIGIPIRFEFERALYLLADEGPFTPGRLQETWKRLLNQGYGGRLDNAASLGWCSTLHYYISYFGFYNWPYTFGYLFSSYIYQQAKKQGPDFRDTLRQLLVGTGCMESVPLAQEILGVDLRDPAFWAESIQSLLDIEQHFQALTDPLVANKISEA